MLPNNAFLMIQQMRQNPVQFFAKRGLNIPDGINDPNEIIQHLMNSGQVTQERYEQARQMAAQFRK